MARIAILTTFMEFQPRYSLTGIVKDQAEMLARFGNEVHLFVSEKYHGEQFSNNVTLHKKIPFTHQKDYTSKKDLTDEHKKIMERTADMLVEQFTELGIDYVFTHDYVFVGWYLPYGLACGMAGIKLKHVRWLHWIHSTCTMRRDWWDLGYYGATHKLVYPNKTDRIRVAEAFGTNINNVKVIPHIKDIRTFMGFRPETRAILDEFPQLMQAEIVQIYPASGDRLEHKRVGEVIKIFGNIKKMGHSVCLFVCNAWANTAKHHDSAISYYKIARKEGLVPGQDVIFTSEIMDFKYDVGMDQEILRELMMLSSLFIYPTREESFGLVLPEIALSSGAFCVLNNSLQQQAEIAGHNGIYFNFGSYTTETRIDNPDQYFFDLAMIIMGRLMENEGVCMKMHMRIHYNMDILYAQYYGPIMAEARLWL